MFATAIFVVMLLVSVISHAEDILKPVSSYASDHYENYVPENVLDGNIRTTWRVFGKGHWIEFDLGSVQAFNAIRIQWHAGHLRMANFKVEISSDGVDYSEVWDDVSSGTTEYFEEYLVMDHMARYVRLAVDGNNKNDWNSIADVEIRNIDYPNATWGPYETTASGWQEPNVPGNSVDWDDTTRWSANGKGQWIQYDYLAEFDAREIEILWYQPNKPRRMTFAIDVKADGATKWTRVFQGKSSGTRGYETYLFNRIAPIRYLKITGYGNADNDWISINEVHVWAYDALNELW